MTMTDENVVEDLTDTEQETAEKVDGRKHRTRDFTKYRQVHADIAEYVNERSGLDPVTPNQIKAILAFRTEFGNTPEATAAREQRKAELAAEKAKYEGMSDEQIKASKAVKRAETAAEKLLAKANAAMEKAKQLADAASGSGEDLAAVVAAQQSEAPKRRGLGRNR